MLTLPIEPGFVAAVRLVRTKVHPLQLTFACAPTLREPPSMMMVLLAGKLVVPLSVKLPTQKVLAARPVTFASAASKLSVSFGLLTRKLGQLLDGKVDGAGTFANGSSWAIVNGINTVPLAQCVLAGMPPTAAIGLALTSDEPVATAAVSDVELVIIPQPRSTSA